MNIKNILFSGAVLVMMGCSGGEQKPKQEASWQREAKFRGFLNISMTQPVDSARHILDTLIAFYSDDSVAIHQMDTFLMPPLSDPNSQLRNEELYIPLLEAVIASPFYDSTAKIRPRFQLEMALKNRVGYSAADFTYTLADGKRGTLYDVASPYTLVYINNPDCHACKEIKEMLGTSTVIANKLKAGQLKIVAIYPDEDLEIWRKHLTDTPAEWINGYDAQLAIRKDELYDLRAIPSLYLLDGEKKVLLKDCMSVDLIESYLVNK